MMNPAPRDTSRGRIRLYRHQADYLLAELNENRHRLVVRRAAAKDAGQEPYEFNRRLDEVDSLLDELRRTMTEMGWDE